MHGVKRVNRSGNHAAGNTTMQRPSRASSCQPESSIVNNSIGKMWRVVDSGAIIAFLGGLLLVAINVIIPVSAGGRVKVIHTQDRGPSRKRACVRELGAGDSILHRGQHDWHREQQSVSHMANKHIQMQPYSQ